ncbi:MAG: PBP1A family penicillin-binding protein [Bdellovibrionota bacterium]
MSQLRKIQNQIQDFGYQLWYALKKLSLKQRIFFTLFLMGIGGVFMAIFIGINALNLPKIDALITYEPRVVTVLFDRNDKVIEEFSTEQRIELKEDEIPEIVKKAFIAAEDGDFYEHHGINPVTLLRAAVKNFLAGSKVQGGSTITQQVAKTFFLTPEKSYSRKVKELFLAIEIEKQLSKDQILSRYLNQIYLGQGAYGIEAASLVYFGKNAKDLSIAEAAILAGLPRAPSRENPISNPAAAKQRQKYVLRRMKEIQAISAVEQEQALNEEVHVKNKVQEVKWPAPYYSEHVRRYLLDKYGKTSLYEEGLKVYTTVDIEAQEAAQNAVNSGLEVIDKRLGLRPPEQNFPSEATRQAFLADKHTSIIEEAYDFKLLTSDGTLKSPVDVNEPTPLKSGEIYPALVIGKDNPRKAILIQVGNRPGSIRPNNYQWAREANPTEIYRDKVIRDPYKELQIGDLIQVSYISKDDFQLDQKPLVQGALLSYRLPDGAINAMVGGYDFYQTRSEFNRAVQAVRQPGSTFKPIIYGAAIEKGVTPASIIVDSPIVYRDHSEKDEIETIWKPDNYSSVSYGDTTLRSALAFSRNIPTIKLLQYIKIPEAISFARKLGIQSKLSEDLSLALGSSGITLEELSTSIGVFANQGKKLTPYFIRKIENRNGEILEEHQNLSGEQVISPQVAFLTTSLMKSVVDYGTGTTVKALGRPVAGKTGTTSDYKDALFVGFIPQMISSVWVGFDENQQVGPAETGTRAAAPIWLDYMKVATKDLEVSDFQVPTGVSQVTVDADTGGLPTSRTKKLLTDYFIDGTAPGQQMRLPSGELSPFVNKPIVITGYGQGISDAKHQDSESQMGEELETEGAGDALRNDF